MSNQSAEKALDEALERIKAKYGCGPEALSAFFDGVKRNIHNPTPPQESPRYTVDKNWLVDHLVRLASFPNNADAQEVADSLNACESARAEVATLREYIAQVDDVLVVNWISVKDGNYKQALHDLVTWEMTIAADPVISAPAAEIARLKRERDALREALNQARQAHDWAEALQIIDAAAPK